MEKILNLLGSPEKKLRYVHITGTNGKGSTSAMVASIVKSAAYKVGLFTSPHLHRYNERIKVNGIDISDEDFISYLEKIKTLLKKNPEIKPALFEVLTVMSFLYFFDKKVELVVLEVGMGGRYDASNIIENSIAVITNIDLEHTAVLGKTKAKIALQKAGIIKQGGTVIVGEQDEKLQTIFKKEAKSKGAKLMFLNLRQIKSVPGHRFSSWHKFDFQNLKKLEISLFGKHQLSNAALAILASQALNKEGFKITKKNIRDGLKNVYWPLRLEQVAIEPTIILDACHNIHGVTAIAKSVDEIFPRENRILILGCSYDKPYKQMAKILAKLSNIIILTQAKYHGVEPKEIVKVLSKKKQIYVSKDSGEAIRLAQKLANKKSAIFVLGGLYLAAEVKEALTPNAVQGSR